MPYSKKQKRYAQAVAHGWKPTKTKGMPKKVAKEMAKAPIKKPKKKPKKKRKHRAKKK